MDPAGATAAALILGRSVHRLAQTLALLFAAGCVDLGSNDAQVTTIWNADLTPEPAYPGLGGHAAAVSRADGTRATILLQGGQPGTSYAWGLRLGTCETPQQQIGPDTDYPGLLANGAGEATQDAVIGATLSLQRDYHVEARLVGPPGARVACGDLAGEPAP